MSKSVSCPDCGVANVEGAQTCAHCNFPLGQTTPPVALPVAMSSAPPTGAPETRPFDPGAGPVRPRRARADAVQPVQMQLWLVTGVAVVLGMAYFAAQGFWKSNVRPVEGAHAEQQQAADLARGVLEKDSTNLAARLELANVLYDTGNWSEAIIHYRAAVRLDPQRPTTLVDMGVCYYNLSHFAEADTLFQHALALDPMQPVALFNLGIVAETQERYPEAMNYFHRAMQANPPDAMRQPLVEHLKNVMEKTGKIAPPIVRPK